MDDYIKKQAAIDVIFGITMYKGTVPASSAVFNIQKIPAEPVREVKRGRWILSRGDSLNFIKCTNCQGLSAEPVAHTVYPWNYCPYCGADMREDGE